MQLAFSLNAQLLRNSMHFLGDSNKTIIAWLLWAVLDIIAFAIGLSTVLNPCYNYLLCTVVYCAVVLVP